MGRFKRVIGFVLAVHLCMMAVLATEGEPLTDQQPQEAGMSESRYLSSYEEPISREEFCYLIISLMAELQDTTVDALYGKLTDKQKNESFVDVDAENRYIALAKKYELVAGMDGNVFSQDLPIKRQEVATITVNFIKQNSPEYYDEDFDYGEDLSIEDHVEIDKWAKPAVEFMLCTELMAVDENDNFDPTAYMTVEEAVMMISNVRVYLSTPLPEEPVEEEPGIPGYVWIAAGAGSAALLVVILIVVLCRRSKRKKREKEAAETRREAELDLRLSPVQVGTDSRQVRQSARPAQTAAPIPPRPAAPETSARPAAPATPAPRPAPAPQSGDGETVYIGAVRTSPRIRITGVQGIEMDQSYDLDAPLTIGRADDCRLQLLNGTVSRKHCSIRWDGSCPLLEVTGARNPVTIQRGGQEIPASAQVPVALQDGDILLLGSLRLKVTLR